MRRYQGPPGDDREYLLPRDRDALDAAWDRYYAEHPDRDPVKPLPVVPSEHSPLYGRMTDTDTDPAF